MAPAVAWVFPVGRPTEGRTTVEIRREEFWIDGRPTLEGRVWRGMSLQGLLPNARLVQGIFDDLNPETRPRFAYPDTGAWDPDRNTSEFVAAMPEWRRHGLLAFTLNLQGGSPEGYSQAQPWHNSAFEADGRLRPDYLARLRRILDKADELRMAVILGLFYFGQDERLRDEEAVQRAVRNAVRWVLEQGYRNVLIEINNEADIAYEHAILQPQRVHELIRLARGIRVRGRSLPASASLSGGKVPPRQVLEASDFVLLHGNGVGSPDALRELIRSVRASKGYSPKPIVVSEDDHFDFEKPDNHMVAALSERAGWGYFDYRRPGEGFEQGFQSVPADWGIRSERKRGFFRLLAEASGISEH
ncbi:MAG: hypothetical protein N2109_06745 [Fimbriimonadales bacterium]|nr:hypothetical protein [Fimbriimonadales bacterium]